MALDRFQIRSFLLPILERVHAVGRSLAPILAELRKLSTRLDHLEHRLEVLNSRCSTRPPSFLDWRCGAMAGS